MIENFKPLRRPLGQDVPPTSTADIEPDFIPPIKNFATATSHPSGFIFTRLKAKLRWPATKKEWIIFTVVSALVLLLFAGSTWAIFHKKPVPKPAPVVLKKVDPPKPTIVPSTLTGLPVKPEVNALPITGVMIENSPDARPQSGLNSAGVVFEAVAEGGITRFLTVFQTNEPVYIGPIRSARPYYLNWLLPYEGSLAHVGGSPDALADIKTLGVRDLDQFANSGSYQRISTRYAPHNVYTTVDKLVELENSKGFGTSTFTGWPRKVAKPVTPATAGHIDLTISGYLYNTHYDYDAAANAYKRSEGGKPHLDERSGAQISPTVVVVMVMPQGLMGDGVHTTYGDVGTGKVYVFQDGISTEGTWTKADRKSQVSFKDATGAILKLNPGQTWLTAVGQPTAVAVTP